MTFIHGKHTYIRLTVGFVYNFNLYSKNFKFAVSSKTTTVAQKGESLQQPFITMPSANMSFTTYVKDYESMNTLLQLGKEDFEVLVEVIDAVSGHSLLSGTRFLSSVKMNGSAGSYYVISLKVALKDYTHTESLLIDTLIQ